ncbi:MAG: DUF4292 domain-containing protein [Bacteroidales bacterium]|jgi:hypothetical protein|nr:DUF4292 domain-containing protein [Bacteroidales bacterium]
MNKYLYIAVAVCILGACTHTKLVVKPREIKQIERTALLDTIIKHFGDYRTVNSHFEVEFKADKKYNVKGNLRIQRDSIIWINITPAFGLEAFRLKLTRDSVYFVNKLGKSYYAGNYAIVRLLTGVDMNYQTVQALFLNELIIYPFTHKTDTAAFFREMNVNSGKNEIELTHKKMLRKNDTLSVQHKFVFDLLYYRLSKTKINDNYLGTKLELKYDNYTVFNSAYYFPTSQNFEVEDKHNKVKIKLQHNNVQFNEEQNYPFTINEKFTRIAP